ncbi:MAG: hypothetical protein V1847_04200 [Candidatus Diapherotrites archaeon]
MALSYTDAVTRIEFLLKRHEAVLKNPATARRPENAQFLNEAVQLQKSILKNVRDGAPGYKKLDPALDARFAGVSAQVNAAVVQRRERRTRGAQKAEGRKKVETLYKGKDAFIEQQLALRQQQVESLKGLPLLKRWTQKRLIKKAANARIASKTKQTKEQVKNANKQYGIRTRVFGPKSRFNARKTRTRLP